MDEILYADEIAEEGRDKGLSWGDAREAVQERSLKYHPTYLGMIAKVVYLDKSDRYVAYFGNGNSAKLSNEVAQFLLTNVFRPAKSGARPTVTGLFKDGVLISAALLYLSKG